MKIRTITLGFNAKYPIDLSVLSKYAAVLHKVKSLFEHAGFEVQTVRMASQPWEEYITLKKDVMKTIMDFDQFCVDNGVEYMNVGTTVTPNNIAKIYEIIANSTHLFSSAILATGNTINYDACLATAKLINKLAPIETEGFANLRFAALFNLPACCPFFPAAYHEGPVAIGIGTENSDIVFSAFKEAGEISTAADILRSSLLEKYVTLESIAKDFCSEHNISFSGIDPSICTSIHPNESIAFAFEKLGLGRFGEPGTIAVARIVTSVLQSLTIKTCGYKGLMLPVMEDYGLAQRNDERMYDITNLLIYSAVCGTGLDTIPLPGDVSSKKLYALLVDLAALSCKLQKPLSARLMPIPGKSNGEMTGFDFPYFVNTKIMAI
jgi:uncharacterized protein (UPF0210 family)